MSAKVSPRSQIEVVDLDGAPLETINCFKEWRKTSSTRSNRLCLLRSSTSFGTRETMSLDEYQARAIVEFRALVDEEQRKTRDG
eukprot:7590250-Pyramimonas_sp.AAC.1